MKKHIPNFITLANLSCGILSIKFLFDSEYKIAIFFIFLGLFFDFFDGLVARLLKVDGELGKQLDSLADVVTFGVAPGFLLFQLNTSLKESETTTYSMFFILLPLLSAFRLAKFNIDKNQSKEFIGVPTPITAIFCCSWYFIYENYFNVFEFVILTPLNFAVFILIISFLLISKIRLFSFKISNPFQLNTYKFQLVFLFISIVSLILFGLSGISLIYVFYILLSILYNFATKKLS